MSKLESDLRFLEIQHGFAALAGTLASMAREHAADSKRFARRKHVSLLGEAGRAGMWELWANQLAVMGQGLGQRTNNDTY